MVGSFFIGKEGEVSYTMKEMHRIKILFFSAVVILVFLLWMFSDFFDVISQALVFSKTSVELHPIASIFIFLILSILSAVSVFFTSIVTIPLAVFAWGELFAIVLLMTGWFIGAMILYGVGRFLGRQIVEYFVSKAKIDKYGGLISREIQMLDIVLIKLALPSEVPSFFLGIVRYPFLKYMAVVVISELPFAVWAVYLSSTFVDDNRVLFIAMLIAGLIFIGIAAQKYKKRHTHA